GAVVASSPELLRHHPAFHPRLSVEGLIGVMVLRVLVSDRSLWVGVKRLGAGNLLTVAPDGRLTEQAQYRVPCFQADIDKAGYDRLSFEEQVDVLAAAVDQAIARHAPATDDQILLLSGGLDSRTLAGFLQRQGATPHLLTFGRADDLEALCAKAVAQHLGWPYQIYDAVSALAKTGDLTAAFIENAAFLTQWGHLAGSTAGLTNMGWHHLAPLGLNGRPLISGLAMDRAICGIRVANPNFEKVMKYELGEEGLSPQLTRRLLLSEPSVQEKLDQVMADIHQSYTHYSDVEIQRAWLLNLYHRNRFARGIGVWRFSFASGLGCRF
ncbi:MAG: asparagine synthase-related protein, partial [Cyanobacteria bacterium]|nr:asparagine synthase-related protein [Cyanobacteriota bacterium]